MVRPKVFYMMKLLCLFDLQSLLFAIFSFPFRSLLVFRFICAIVALRCNTILSFQIWIFVSTPTGALDIFNFIYPDGRATSRSFFFVDDNVYYLCIVRE